MNGDEQTVSLAAAFAAGALVGGEAVEYFVMSDN
jgi:hypothetical protein